MYKRTAMLNNAFIRPAQLTEGAIIHPYGYSELTPCSFKVCSPVKKVGGSSSVKFVALYQKEPWNVTYDPVRGVVEFVWEVTRLGADENYEIGEGA